MPAGPVLDGLGVTLALGETDRLTEVLVIGKVLDLETGRVALLVESNDLDWIAQAGLHAAAGQIYAQSSFVHKGDDE